MDFKGGFLLPGLVEMAVRFLGPYATSHVKRFGDYALDLGKPPKSWLSEAAFRGALNQITTEARRDSEIMSRRERPGSTDTAFGPVNPRILEALQESFDT